MARTARNPKLDTRSARAKLKPRREPYWAAIAPGRHLGYRRIGPQGGTWIAKLRIAGAGRWTRALGTADDVLDPGGDVLTFAEAQERARAWYAEQEREAAGGEAAAKEDPAPAPYTVERACQSYVEDLRVRKGEQPAREAAGRLRKHLIPVLGNRLLATLTAADVRGWRNGLVKDGDGHGEEIVRQSRDTANRILSIAKAVFNHAFNGELVADDRAWRRVKAFPGVGEARKIILTDAELQRLVDACAPGLRELVLIGAWTGARLGELTSPRVRDFDAKGARLRVSGKTGGREIHLIPDAVTLLRQMASGKRPDAPLLTVADGGTWTKSLHQRPFAEAVERAGLGPETTFYALRHSYISRALVAGVPTKAVADHCGTSMAMIERFYAKFIPSDQARYATAAAPTLRVERAAKVVALQPAAG